MEIRLLDATHYDVQLVHGVEHGKGLSLNLLGRKMARFNGVMSPHMRSDKLPMMSV